MNEGTLESLLLLDKTFKSSLLKRFQSISNTNYFVDVGANYGQTLAEVYAFNSSIKYFGFEPNPEAFRLLKKIARLNRIDAQLYPWACTSEAKPIELFTSSEIDSGATIFPEIRPDTYENTQGEWIAGYSLDSVLPDSIPKSFVLKIDVEGSENEVLKGASRILENKRPLILCEVLHAHRNSEINHNNSRKKEIEDLLLHHNYNIFMCTLNKENRDKLERIEKITEFPKNIIWKDSPHTCDFVLVPNEISPNF
jgi:FkbM family methyltransferase